MAHLGRLITNQPAANNHEAEPTTEIVTVGGEQYRVQKRADGTYVPGSAEPVALPQQLPSAGHEGSVDMGKSAPRASEPKMTAEETAERRVRNKKIAKHIASWATAAIILPTWICDNAGRNFAAG